MEFDGTNSKTARSNLELGYRRVRNTLETCRISGSVGFISSAPGTNPEIRSDLTPFEQALISDEHGDVQAAELYARAIDQQDCVADALQSRYHRIAKGNATKALDCFTSSLKHNPRHSEAHYNLGNLYFDLNDFRLAQIHYEMACEVDASFANSFFNLALIQAINNELDAAIRALRMYAGTGFGR